MAVDIVAGFRSRSGCSNLESSSVADSPDHEVFGDDTILQILQYILMNHDHVAVLGCFSLASSVF